jgi:hypothetical protein
MLLCILEAVEVVLEALESTRGPVLYPGRRVGRATCAEVVRDCALYAGDNEWCAMCAMGAGGRDRHAACAPYTGG